MRKLASVREISKITPIEGADRIELATVDGWNVVVNKGLHSLGEKVVYFEIDSFLPIKDEFEFLRKSSFKRLSDGSEGFRLKTIRLRGQVSQGLITPISVLGDMLVKVGEDVTEKLGVVKYEPPVPAQLSGKIKGYFPSFVRKTDEERIQNLTSKFEDFKELNFFVMEKLDGTSFTSYLRDSDFGVCSRNLDLKREDEQTHWKVAIDYDIESKLKSIGRNLAIQGEVIGEGIQKNRYRIKGHKLFVFNIFDIGTNEYLTKSEMVDMCKTLGLDMCPIISVNTKVPNSVKEILDLAEGKSVLNSETEREGLVWVSNDLNERISFKTISNKFLLNGGE